MRRVFIVFLCLTSLLFPYPEVYFSKDHLDEKLIDLIHGEKKGIKMAIYCFTSKPIGKALLEAQKKGVDIELIIDPCTLRNPKSLEAFFQEGGKVYIFDDTKEGKKPSLMHHKFAIFQDNLKGASLVWTGSFNFTHAGAFKHKENALVVSDPSLAKKFTEEFEMIKRDSCDLCKDFLKLTRKDKSRAKLTLLKANQ